VVKVLSKLDSLLEGSPILVDFSELYPSWLVFYHNKKIKFHYSKHTLAFGANKGNNCFNIIYFKFFLPRHKKFYYKAKPFKTYSVEFKQSKFSNRNLEIDKLKTDFIKVPPLVKSVFLKKTKHFIMPLNLNWFNNRDFNEFKLINKQ
jgi:hypothetical protein